MQVTSECRFDAPQFQWQNKALIPFAMPRFRDSARIAYQRALRVSPQSSDFRGKIVFVGAEIPNEKRSAYGSIPSTGLYGYEVQAGIASDLLSNSWLRRLTSTGELIALCILSVVTVVARRFLPKTDIDIDTHIIGTRALPAGLLILVFAYAITVLIAYSKKSLLFEPGYDVAVIALAYFLASRPAKKKEIQEWL